MQDIVRLKEPRPPVLIDAMPTNAALNQLLIDLGRSLLQYVGESWPWTASTSSARQTVEKLVAQQQKSVAALAEMLSERAVPIDFGSYPTEYTDLQYLSLQFLLGELVRGGAEDVASVKSTIDECRSDAEAASLLEAILKSQTKILDELKTLQASATAGATIVV